MGECYVAACGDTAIVEAIGTYDGVFGIVETVAFALCERHAEALRNEVVVLATA